MKILALAAVFVAALQAQVLRTVPYNLVRLDPALDALIDQMAEGHAPLDELRFRRLKKRRLALRDDIARLQRLLEPKEPA